MAILIIYILGTLLLCYLAKQTKVLNKIETIVASILLISYAVLVFAGERTISTIIELVGLILFVCKAFSTAKGVINRLNEENASEGNYMDDTTEHSV